MLNSGTGEFGWVDIEKKAVNPIAHCPGCARGQNYATSHAVIGVSLARESRTFRDLPLHHLPGICNPSALGVKTNEVMRVISVANATSR